MTTLTDHILDKVIGYEYDQNGNRAKMIGPDGEETIYRYDALNRVEELVDPDGGNTLFGYDKLGRRDSIAFANGVKGNYFYDPAGRLENIVYKNTSGDVIQSFAYTHDKIGNRASKTFVNGQSESYGYDDLHRLTAATYPNGRTVDYQYDPVGNREFVTESWDGGGSETTSYTYTDFNQVLTTTDSNGMTAYAWDDNGNMIGKQKPNGEITQYDYNFENRLISILYPNATTNAFGYDPQGIRTFREDSQGRHDYLIDQMSVLAEYNGVGTKAAWYNHNPQRIDEIISQVQSAGKLYHLVDGLGSVTGLVNQAQVKVAAYTYDAYGAVTDSEVQPGIQNPYLFTGREMDTDSGLQYNRARYYHNGIGSWNREDPVNIRNSLGKIPPNRSPIFNGYFLYSNSPLVEIDPYGSITFSWSIVGGSGGGALLAGSSNQATVDLSFDTEGNELLSTTISAGPQFGITLSWNVSFVGMLATNCPTVCELLGPSIIIIINITMGVGVTVGVGFIYWRSKQYYGFGYSMFVGSEVVPLLFNVTVEMLLYSYTFRLAGTKCKDNQPCPA